MCPRALMGAGFATKPSSDRLESLRRGLSSFVAKTTVGRRHGGLLVILPLLRQSPSRMPSSLQMSRVGMFALRLSDTKQADSWRRYSRCRDPSRRNMGVDIM